MSENIGVYNDPILKYAPESRSLVINPAAGNEPIILGARTGMAINQELISEGNAPLQIIVPITGDRQRRVLQDEFKDIPSAEHVLLDDGTGEILGNVLRSQGDFANHLNVLRAEHDTTRAYLNRRLGREATGILNLHTLDGKPVAIEPSTIIGSFDTGGRVTFDTLMRDFAFPALTSELIRATRESGQPYSLSDMLAVEEQSRRAEQGYSTRFLPLIHTLTGMVLSEDPAASMRQKFAELTGQSTTTLAGEVTFTPPMKSEFAAKESDEVPGESIFAMLSGTDNGAVATIDATLRAAKGADYTVLTNPWAEDVEGTVKVSPTALSDPRIKTVVSRAGWGTGWQMLNSGRPWLVVPAEAGDDPEIAFNHQAIERLGIGQVIDPSNFSASALKQAIELYGPRVRDLRELTTEHYGTSDGIRYMAKQLAQQYRASGLLMPNA